jgi:hypothetical protein
MPYFTNIGPGGSNKQNPSGIGSRGYWIFRRGTDVYTRWGAVTIVGRRPYKLQWAHGWCWERRIRCASVEAAMAIAAEAIRQRQLPTNGYVVMKQGRKIHGRPAFRRDGRSSDRIVRWQ